MTTCRIGDFEVARDEDTLTIRRRLTGDFAWQAALAGVLTLLLVSSALGHGPLPAKEPIFRLGLGALALGVVGSAARVVAQGRGALVLDRRIGCLRHNDREVCPLDRVSHLRNLRHMSGSVRGGGPAVWWVVSLVVADDPIPREVGLLANRFHDRDDAEQFAGAIAEFLGVDVCRAV